MPWQARGVLQCGKVLNMVRSHRIQQQVQLAIHLGGVCRDWAYLLLIGIKPWGQAMGGVAIQVTQPAAQQSAANS